MHKLKNFRPQDSVLCLFLAFSFALLPAALAQPASDPPAAAAEDDGPETIPFLEPIPDHWEPFNRTMNGINHGLMIGVVRPTSKVYRFVVPKPVRRGVRNVGHNLRYPGRLLNSLLQGKWAGARDETYRFLANTGLGWAGLFNVADPMGIPKSEEDFGQTFGKWGWDPHLYLMLPLLGPSNDRDAPGSALDWAAYPLTWLPPWASVITYNNLTDQVDSYEAFTATQYDPYHLVHYVSSFARKKQVLDYDDSKQEESSLQTLQSIFLTYQDPKFPQKRRTRSVEIPATGRKLRYTCWLQKGEAPVVYIMPGLGSHRRSKSVMALAEMVYRRGFSAVCISSAYNFEFMEQAALAQAPGYTPCDVHDIHGALTAIDRELERKYSGRLGRRILMGYSMGGFHALYIASRISGTANDWIEFDRYLALDCPVNLLYGLQQLDAYYQAPLEWPPDERETRMEHLFLKVVELAQGDLSPEQPLPFSRIESEYLIGLAFRFTLGDLLHCSQRRHDFGVLQTPLRSMSRRRAYAEIRRYSYQDYFEKFITPHYQQLGIDPNQEAVMRLASDLTSLEERLQANDRVRVFVNRNDFLLRPGDVAWYENTLGPERFTAFEEGGHLGNLHRPEVQELIMGALADLAPAGRATR